MAQALILALGGILTAVLNRLSGGALHASIAWFTRRLLDLATKRLPENQRERFAEEWATCCGVCGGHWCISAYNLPSCASSPKKSDATLLEPNPIPMMI